MKTILHIAKLEKFIPPFIQFARSHLSQPGYDNFFFTFGEINKHPYPIEQDCYHAERSKNKVKSLYIRYKKLIEKMVQADKIVIHGLFDTYLIFILFIKPELLKKCYWMVWGGDLYYRNRKKRSFKYHYKEFLRRRVIKDMGHIITYVDGDAKLIREWYQSHAEYHECIGYLSNLYTAIELSPKVSNTICIQIGNSADPENNHEEILNALLEYKDEDIKIYAPLSYGSKENAKLIAEKGKELFGEKFNAMTDFMQYSDYLKFLSDIDIAIFNHNRQQAMGNTINLLALGKTVYLKRDTAQWDLFGKMGVKIKSLDKLDLTILSQENTEQNSTLIKNYFNIENLERQYRSIFYK